jgi:PKD repeat protein
LSAVITGPGTYSLGMVSASSDSAYYSSREGTNPPQLIVFSASDPPEPSFSATPVSGTAPLQVQFTDTSSGSPSSWLWDFGDGATSNLQHPSHTYTSGGLYSVSLTAANVIGSNAVTQTDLIDVQPTPPVVTVNAVADANVKSNSANTNYGTATTFRVKFSSTETHYSYLRFVVAPGSNPITGAKLRLYVTDGSADGGTVYLVDNSWSENTITWNNAPPITGSPVGQFVNVVAGTFVELDLSPVITGPGTYSLGMTSASSDSAYYSSREGVNPPQLDVFSASDPPVPSFSADPVSGTAPLLVHFTDTSSGTPSSWLWDFGDGTTSDLQNPSHAYTAPGLYSVSLTATNVIGSDTVTQTDLIDVQPTPPVVTFNAVADANVKSSSPNSNYGTATTFRVKFTETEIHYSYVKFVVAAGSSPVIGGTMRLFVTDGSPDGGTVYLVSNSWNESTITWNNAPAITGSPLGQLVNVVAGTFVEIDLSSVITAPGTYTFALTSASSNSSYYMSKEGGTPPQLDVSYQN